MPSWWLLEPSEETEPVTATVDHADIRGWGTTVRVSVVHEAGAPTAPRTSTDAPDLNRDPYDTLLRMILTLINHCGWGRDHLRQPREDPRGLALLGPPAADREPSTLSTIISFCPKRSRLMQKLRPPKIHGLHCGGSRISRWPTCQSHHNFMGSPSRALRPPCTSSARGPLQIPTTRKSRLIWVPRARRQH